MKTKLILILGLLSLAGCGVKTLSQRETPQPILHMDQTPPELSKDATAADVSFPIGLLAVAAGIALVIYLPLEKTLGIAIAGGGGSLVAIAIAARVAMAHPHIIMVALALFSAGCTYCVYENWRSWFPEKPINEVCNSTEKLSPPIGSGSQAS
jgi:hypothetical protein